MTAPLSAQSAIEILESEWHTGDSVQALIVLRRVVKDYSSLRAENERLREQHKTDEGVNLRLCEMHTNQQKELHNLGKAYKKAEAELKVAEGTIEEITKAWCLDAAQLEKQRPLVEAIMKAGVLESIQAEIDYQEIDDAPDEVTDMFREALKLRSEK